MRQPVYFILPPRTLLIDVCGPAEALWMANRYQSGVRFREAGAADQARLPGSTPSTSSRPGSSPEARDSLRVLGMPGLS